MINNQVIGHIIHEAVMESDANIIAERNGKAYATGPIQDLETENRNGRIYTKEEMEPEVYSDRIQKELIPTGNMRGHDGHPSSQDLAVQSVIDPKLCSVQFDKIWIEGNIIHANYHGTNNELGRAFNLDLLEGCKLSFSLRALGSIDRSRNGKCYVRNPRIVTWDRVIYPSHKIAYTDKLIDPKTASGKLHESALITESAALSGTIIPVLNSQVVSYIKHESANIQSILNTFDVLYESAIICNNGRNVTLKLKSGDTILVNLEQYIQDEIMNYCYNK
jgi:hypothetical protein